MTKYVLEGYVTAESLCSWISDHSPSPVREIGQARRRDASENGKTENGRKPFPKKGTVSTARNGDRSAETTR